MKASALFKEYVWLVNTIRRAGRITLCEINERWLCTDMSGVYGNDPEYQKYAKNTPILIPFLPIYSLVKYKWLQA